MSNLPIFDVAGSALQAQSVRLNTIASNLANADSVAGPDGKPFRAKQVIFDQQKMAVGGGLESISLVQNQHMNLYRMKDEALLKLNDPDGFKNRKRMRGKKCCVSATRSNRVSYYVVQDA